MLKKLKSALFSFLLSLGFFVISSSAVYAQTQAWREGYCTGTDEAKDVATIQGLQCLLANILLVAMTLIGLSGFIMLIIGSLRWMILGGNQQNAQKARSTMTLAIVGLVVALSSFIILKLVSDFTGITTILDFTIPGSDKDWTQPDLQPWIHHGPV